MTNVITLTSANFESSIKNNKILLIDWWAEWCQPCMQFATIYEKVAAMYPDIMFGKINIAKEEDLSQAFHIRSIPHLMILKDEIAIYSEAGSIPKSTLKELVDQALVVDVSEIRSKMEQEQEQEQGQGQEQEQEQGQGQEQN